MIDTRKAYLLYLEDYCNQEFDIDNLPGGVSLSLDILDTLDPLKIGIASETVGDLSVSYTSDKDMPDKVKQLIAPYVRPHLVGNKSKRKYRRG